MKAKPYQILLRSYEVKKFNKLIKYYESILPTKFTRADIVRIVISELYNSKIKKATKPSYWYSKKSDNAIGKEFEVEQDRADKNNWSVINSNKYVSKCDAVVLKTLR